MTSIEKRLMESNGVATTTPPNIKTRYHVLRSGPWGLEPRSILIDIHGGAIKVSIIRWLKAYEGTYEVTSPIQFSVIFTVRMIRY